MIDTIIFDIGRVLVKFEWREYLDSFHFPAETTELLGKAIFLNPAWSEYDRGAFSDKEILKRLCAAAPGHEREVEMVFLQFPTCLSQLPHAIPWITSLKERGSHVYYLSNYAKTPREGSKEALSFMDLCDGGLMSYEIKRIKPDPEIYQALFDRYPIVPAHAVFIDDTEPNLTAAAQFGLHTILFHDYDQASAELEAILTAS